MPLTDTRIRIAKALEKAYKLSDGGGLHLEVRPTGKKLWRYRFRCTGKRTFTPSANTRTSCYWLRAERDEARKLVKEGINPAHERRLRRLKTSHAAKQTFEAVAREWAEEHAKDRKWSRSYTDTVTSVLEKELPSARTAADSRYQGRAPATDPEGYSEAGRRDQQLPAKRNPLELHTAPLNCPYFIMNRYRLRRCRLWGVGSWR